MHRILIISASVRKGRKSDRVALFFKNYIQENALAEVSIADLDTYRFPIFEERLKNLSDPPEGLVEIAARIQSASAILMVTPEYNGGYPASLKNLVDALYEEWLHKPIAIATVSSGPFGASQVLQQISFVLWKMGAQVVPVKFQVAQVENSYNELGEPAQKEKVEKLAGGFLKGLLDSIR